MAKKSGLGFLAALLLLGLPIVLSPWRIQGPVELPNSQVKSDRWFPHLRQQMSYPDMAADAAMEPAGENYIGVRYKALLVEDELSETGWVLLFGGSGFTVNGEYQPHFIDLMIKAGWASLYDDPLCDDGFPQPREVRDNFTIQFGLSDYEDSTPGYVNENDIGAWTRDPQLFPLMFTNIDSTNPRAADKIMAEYQVDNGGTLEGREIEVSFVREEVTTLPQDKNFFMDPDLGGSLLCKPNSQDDILYRHWVATLAVPSLGITSSVDFYVNASQGDKINGTNALNFLWENPGRPRIESDKFKVIVFDPEVRTISGEWKKATRFLVDYRTPRDELPLNANGQLVGGFRKVSYKGRPAMEASFGYGYTDYVVDGNPEDYEPSNATKGVIDLEATCPDFVVPLGVGVEDIQAVAAHWHLPGTDPGWEPRFDLDSDGDVDVIDVQIVAAQWNQLCPGETSVLFDEAHSEWVSIEENYQEFADRLRARGYTVERTTQPITFETLRDYDVYVIGTAWGSFAQNEVDAIAQFVNEGGGVFLTGLGWSWVNPDLGRTLDNYPMNVIGSNFGIRFLDDGICDPTDNYGSSCTPVFHEMLSHSLTEGVALVGGPISPAPVEITLPGQAVVYGDGDSYSTLHYPAGTNPPVLVATTYGSGRVAALGHEAYLSTDDYDGNGTPNLEDYDNLQMGLNIVDWLNTP